MPMWNIHFTVTDAQSFIEAEDSDTLQNLSQYELDFSKLNKSEKIPSSFFKNYRAELVKTVTC